MNAGQAMQAAFTEQRVRDLERLWLPRLREHHPVTLPVLDLRDMDEDIERLRTTA